MEFIDLKKSEIRKVIENTTKKVLDSYNSPFTYVTIKSEEFIVDEKDIEVKKLKKTTTSRGFVMYLQERITKDLICYIQDKEVKSIDSSPK